MRTLLRGFAFASNKMALCNTCAGHCCTGEGRFGFTSIVIMPHEANNPAFARYVEKSETGDKLRLPMGETCRFLEKGRCSIYDSRPEACRNAVCHPNSLGHFGLNKAVQYGPWRRMMAKSGLLEATYDRRQKAWRSYPQEWRKRDFESPALPFRVLRIRHNRFVVRADWHGERFTCSLRAVPDAYHHELNKQLNKFGYEMKDGKATPRVNGKARGFIVGHQIKTTS